MNNNWQDRVIALGGIFQAVSLIEQLAKTGYLETEHFETCIKSLFVRNPSCAEEVYGSVHNILKGLDNLEVTLNDHKAKEHRDSIRYSLGIILLQKILSKRGEILQKIGHRLERAEQQVEHFDLTHDNVIGNLADIYTDTISTFRYRIHVTGEYHYLQQDRVANQVRALLLAAIRAATLWRQSGGNRWQLLLQRKKLHEQTKKLIANTKQTLH